MESSDELKPIGAYVDELASIGIKPATGVCEVHGEFRTMVKDGREPECPKCLDARHAKATRERYEKERLEHLYKHASLPRRYVDSGIRTYPIDYPEQEQALAVITKYLKSLGEMMKQGRGLIFTGPKGTGKTRLVCALANNAMHQLVSVRYTTMADMLADIKRAYDTAGMTEASQINRLVTAYDILILDEVDINRGSDNDLQLIFQVVNGRYNEVKPTIVVSNQTPDTLGSFIGERAADRLRDAAMVVVCDWPSYRSTAV